MSSQQRPARRGPSTRANPTGPSPRPARPRLRPKPVSPLEIPGVDAPGDGVAHAGPANHHRAASIAAIVIRWSNRESAADQLLRAELKKARGLDPQTGALASQMVFSYYRWLGWLAETDPVEARLDRALALQRQFDRDPSAWDEIDLIARAVPAWTRDVLDFTPAWARALQGEPTMWIRTKPGQAEAVARQLPGAVPGPIPDALEYRGSADLYVQPAFQAGEFEIQDLASQFVGHLCAPQPGETWWDACAGEGGKTMHLSALMRNKGLIWASDRAEWRLQRLKRRAARAQAFNYRAAAWDGSERLPTKTMFDGVLVDAPCTGIGTWQKNPHARWSIRREDVAELAAIQGTLLDRAAASIKPGGRLVYSVCTLTRAETSETSAAFSARHPEFSPERFACSWLTPTCGPGPDVWIRPEDWRSNGMYVAQWRRNLDRGAA